MITKEKKKSQCERCGKPKNEWETPGIKTEDGEYCCEGCLKDTGCTCKHNQYDFDNRDTQRRPVP